MKTESKEMGRVIMQRTPALAIVILAAGQSKRMRSSVPKVLHPIGGLPMIRHVVRTASDMSPSKLLLVAGPHSGAIQAEAAKEHAGLIYVTQAEPKGTGQAVQCVLPYLQDFEGTVLVLFGDTPLLESKTLQTLCASLEQNLSAGMAVLGMRLSDPRQYGRICLDSSGHVAHIVEAPEARMEELESTLCNSGVMAFKASVLRDLLPQLTSENRTQEYYLTQMVTLCRTYGSGIALVLGERQELAGVNDRLDLAETETWFQTKARAQALREGVTLLDPKTVYLSYDTVLQSDVTLYPYVILGPGVTLKTGSTVYSFSHLEGVTVEAGGQIGPFARLRAGTQVGEGAILGNFVEAKEVIVGAHARIKHLTYIGNATIGEGTNIGAGTIVCNYDGKTKYPTTLGKDVFVGSNSTLVAPLTIGEKAFIAAGSTVTESVSSEALVFGRSRQEEKPLGARKLRPKSSEKMD